MYDVPDILPILNQIVEKTPNYVYSEAIPTVLGQSCVYWNYDENRASCIVGRMLDQMGLLNATMKTSANTTCVDLALHRAGITNLFTGRAIEFLKALQYKQDTQMPWAKALLYAIDKDKETQGEPQSRLVPRYQVDPTATSPSFFGLDPASHYNHAAAQAQKVHVSGPVQLSFFKLDTDGQPSDPIKVDTKSIVWQYA